MTTDQERDVPSTADQLRAMLMMVQNDVKTMELLERLTGVVERMSPVVKHSRSRVEALESKVDAHHDIIGRIIGVMEQERGIDPDDEATWGEAQEVPQNVEGIAMAALRVIADQIGEISSVLKAQRDDEVENRNLIDMTAEPVEPYSDNLDPSVIRYVYGGLEDSDCRLAVIVPKDGPNTAPTQVELTNDTRLLRLPLSSVVEQFLP